MPSDPYTVVGVLAPTGTRGRPARADASRKRLGRPRTPPCRDAGADEAGAEWQAPPAPAQHADDDREITLVLVRYATPLAAAGLAARDQRRPARWSRPRRPTRRRACSRCSASASTWSARSRACWSRASTLLLFVALAQALEERRYDLAILRALGARRRDLVFVLMVESVTLALAGALLGLLLGHLAAASIGAWLPAAAPLAGAAWRLSAQEGVVVALALAGGILAACWPAWRASRLDVAATLSDA